MANMDAGIKNISDLADFGHKLTTDSEELMSLFVRLNQQMRVVCEGWTDKQNTQFMVQFVQKQKEIKEMSDIMNEYAAFISRVVKAAEAYANQR